MKPTPIALAVATVYGHLKPVLFHARWVQNWDLLYELSNFKRLNKRLRIWGTAEQVKAGIARGVVQGDKFSSVHPNQNEVK